MHVKKMFLLGKEINLEGLKGVNNIYVVSSCVKLFMNQLPEPLVPYNMYMPMLEAASK